MAHRARVAAGVLAAVRRARGRGGGRLSRLGLTDGPCVSALQQRGFDSGAIVVLCYYPLQGRCRSRAKLQPRTFCHLEILGQKVARFFPFGYFLSVHSSLPCIRRLHSMSRSSRAYRYLTKPMSVAYSRKQRRHRSRPYLRIRPCVLLHTRLPHASARATVGRAGHRIPAPFPSACDAAALWCCGVQQQQRRHPRHRGPAPASTI